MASKIFLVFLVLANAGICIITDAFSPVPTLLGQLVKYPYFLFTQYPKTSSIFLSTSIAKFKVFSNSNPLLKNCILRWSSSPIIIHMFSSSLIKMLPVSFLFNIKFGLTRFFSSKLIFVISSKSFIFINFNPYPMAYRFSFILFSNFSISSLLFRLNLNPFKFLANLILVLIATSDSLPFCKYQFICIPSFYLS